MDLVKAVVLYTGDSDVSLKEARVIASTHFKELSDFVTWYDTINDYTGRFFLEEIIKRTYDSGDWRTLGEYPKQLLKDWMKEKVKKQPLDDIQRDIIVNTYQGDKWREYYFENEAELKEIIG